MSILRTYHVNDGPNEWLFEVEFPANKIVNVTRHEHGEDYWETAFYSEASPEVRLKLINKINADPRGITEK